MAEAPKREKFEYRINPLSGAAIWLISPEDARGRHECADLHLSIETAKTIVATLTEAILDAETSATVGE